MVKEFREQPQEKRKAKASELISMNQNKIPVIIEVDSKSNLQDIQKVKYLVSSSHTVKNLLQKIRDEMHHFDKSQSLYVYSQQFMINQEKRFDEVYKNYKDEDLFLYLKITSIGAFGHGSAAA